MLDKRLLRIAIQIGGQVKYYEDLKIEVSGSKYNNAIANEATVKITNIDRKTRDYILTETTPFRTGAINQKIIVYAGRESIGYSVVFIGDIFRATVSQPPDIGLTIKCMTGFASQSNIIANTQGKESPLKTISKSVADSLGLQLVFEATNKKIANYNYTGSAFQQVNNLSQIGGVNAFIDDDKLIVKNYNEPIIGGIKIIKEETGMIGIPEITEYGVKVKFLWDASTSIGQAIQVESKLNPAVNGNYTIYKLTFDLANRDTQFYYVAEATRQL